MNEFNIAADTANGLVNSDQLEYEIAAAIPLVPLGHINVNVRPGKLDVYMTAALSPADEAVLTAVVAAHQGFGVVAELKGTIHIANGETVVNQDASWQVLGGIVTTPRFFFPDVTKIIARIIGQHKGTGGQVSLNEDMDGNPDEEKINPFFELPDTLGEWKRFKVDSNVSPRDGLRNAYVPRTRLNGTANLSIRYATISMIKVLIV